MATGTDDPFVGRRLGRYQIEAILGRGKDATVYAAHDPIIGRTVAIKILDPFVARDPEVRARFLREGAALSQLRHPHILPIYEVAERDGIAYLARQQTAGGTLRSYLAEAGPLPLGEASALLRPIAVALDYAHRQGFIHGNLRPSNILRTPEGQVFLTDFIAPGEAIPTASAATTVVRAIDAPEYAAPEQTRGGAIASADLYVLGVILYETLTGRPPFRAEGEDESARNILTRHFQASPPPPAPSTPRSVRRWRRSCCVPWRSAPPSVTRPARPCSSRSVRRRRKISLRSRPCHPSPRRTRRGASPPRLRPRSLRHRAPLRARSPRSFPHLRRRSCRNPPPCRCPRSV